MNRRDFLLRSGAAVSLGLLGRDKLKAETSAAAPTPADKPTAEKPVPVQAPTVITEFKPLRRNTGIFTGRGGTIGWLVNNEAIVIVDTQFPDTAAVCLNGLPGRGNRTLDAVINTHHHADHTSGNKIFKPAAKMLVAQKNVPGLQAAAFERNPESGEPVFPDTLFAEVWRKDVGDEVVSAQYFGPAHTGGDIVVYFERANVAHVGDLVFNRIYPFLDRPGGSSVRGWLKALEEVGRNYPKDVQIICGHGKQPFGVTGTLAEVTLQHDFFSALVAHVEAEMKAGKSRDEIIKLKNLAGFPDHFADDQTSRLPAGLGVVYDELSGPGA
jgi:glyoxylase-like metal-dependent hydrolase (beta-lactamase superfamily II)